MKTNKYIFPNFGQVTELPTNRFAAQADAGTGVSVRQYLRVLEQWSQGGA